MSIPSVESRLPELVRFAENLAAEAESGRLSNGAALAEKVRGFFSVEMMDGVDSVIPGWREMASYADGQTLFHVMTVYAALLQCPEYHEAIVEQQTLMQWIVLLHDLAKIARRGG